MISIRKYLNRPPGAAPPAEPAPENGLFLLCSGVLESLKHYVLTAKRWPGLRTRLSALEEELTPDLDAGRAAVAAQSVMGILSEYDRGTQLSALRNATEIQDIVGMLNEALMTLAGGSERSVSRLKDIQTSLEKTSALQDIVALKASLAGTIRFVREESAREQQAAAVATEAFEAKVSKAHRILAGAQTGLPGREEGVRALAEAAETASEAQPRYVAMFRFERIQSVVQRYGPEAAEELMLLILSQRAQGLAPAGTVYRWTICSLMTIFQRDGDLPAVRAEVEALNRAPLVQRLTVGNRTATLTLSPSHLVGRVQAGSVETLVEELDGFSRYKAVPQ